MGEAVDTIPSILNKCLFVSPNRHTDRRAGKLVRFVYLVRISGFEALWETRVVKYKRDSLVSNKQ